ncbi:MAG: galactokinase [Ilumatobacteraceae bacterium]
MKTRAPGRVNLIGDHTDYTGGLVFPMAINRWTTVEGIISDNAITLTSNDVDGIVRVAIGAPFDADMQPSWGRYVSAVSSVVNPLHGITGSVSTTVPVGAGLSSSAALELAVAYALNDTISPTSLALLMQQAERIATGVPTGIMDQLCIASAREGHGTLIDCATLGITHVEIPTDVEFVVQFIAHRTLEGSEYTDRVRECADAEDAIGPLRHALLANVNSIETPMVARRARHVITENQRVLDFADVLSQGDYVEAGRLMRDSHESLSRDFEVSTPQMDAVVNQLCETPGVFGARMTGGGFGGCVVAMCQPGVAIDGWRVSPVGAACRLD